MPGGLLTDLYELNMAVSICIVKLSVQLSSTVHSIRNAPALGVSSRGGRIRRSSAASGGDTVSSSSRRIA
jgi:hypothetical protein